MLFNWIPVNFRIQGQVTQDQHLAELLDQLFRDPVELTLPGNERCLLRGKALEDPIAFQFISIGRRLLSEGSLNAALVPAYLRTEEGKGFGGLPWFSEYGFQQTRGFRALKVWMALKFFGDPDPSYVFPGYSVGPNLGVIHG